MSRFIQGEDRSQATLFPERLDDYVAEDSAVRVIDDFRKDNGVAIRLVCREFMMLCRKLNLFANAFVAIDGSKFKAVNSRDRNFTRAKMKRRVAEVDASIDRYLESLDGFDPFPDQNARSSEYRDELACVGVQHEADDENHGYKTSHRGHRGIASPFLLIK